MDFEFKTDFIGRPVARFSMGHEALGSWFSDELGSNHSRITELLAVIEQLCNCQRWEFELPGSEYYLSLTRDTATVKGVALSLSTDQDQFDSDNLAAEELDFYDDELHTSCGLDDFKAALLSWQSFIAKHSQRYA